MVERVKWGVLGNANIARACVIPAIRKSSNGTLHALATRSPEQVWQLGTEHEIQHVYDEYDALIADPAIEAVYIPLPNHLHHPWALKAVSAGKHVLCEKPMFVQMAGYFLFEAHQRGYKGQSLYQFMKENFAQHADPHFNYQWNHSTESEKITLLAMLALSRAKKEDEPAPDVDQVTKLHPRAKHNLRDLATRGLVVSDGGRYALCSPVFADWIAHEITAAAGEKAEEQSAEAWLRGHEEVDKGLGDKVKSVLPGFNKKYWPMMGAFVKELSMKLVVDEVVHWTTLLPLR